MNFSLAESGKKRRMGRIFKTDGKAVMIAVNHGLGYGPAEGIDDMHRLFGKIMPQKPDAITMHKGIAKCFADELGRDTALILKVTNATRYFSPEETTVAQVADAVCLGADAIAVGLSLCGPKEADEIARAGRFVSEADAMGIPVIAHSYPCGGFLNDAEKFLVKNVAYAVRVAQEIGIDIIKTYWTGDQKSFEQIVAIGAPAKVVISGGPRCATLRECFEMTKAGIDSGASGITYGRNIWQHPYPEAVTAGLIEIVHNGANVNTALEAAQSISGTKLT